MTSTPMTLDQAEHRAALTNLARLRATIAQNDLAHCTIWFESARGEGDFDFIQMFGQSDEAAAIDLSGSKADIATVAGQSVPFAVEDRDGSLIDLARAVAEHLMERHHAGWRQGRGSEGHIQVHADLEMGVEVTFDAPEMFINCFSYEPNDPFAEGADRWEDTPAPTC